MKEGTIEKSAAYTDADLELINRFTRKKLKPDEVYTFSVLLCDNDTDRDFERFSNEALKTLSEMFVGKTGILDHERKSSGQWARIYRCYLKEDKGRKTAEGEDYMALFADAYIPKTAGSTELIEKIDSGILKEVSVGCSVKSSVCSICGRESCAHIKGRVYDGKTCVHILSAPYDAYEFSFVAVPSQRKAGVRKNYREDRKLKEKIKSLTEGESLEMSFSEVQELKAEIDGLEKSAAWGEEYRKSLTDSCMKFSRMLQPELKVETVKSMLMGLDFAGLSETEKVWRNLAGEKLPLYSQLAGTEGKKTPDNKDFRI